MKQEIVSRRSRVLVSDTPDGAARPFVDQVHVQQSSSGAPWEDAIVTEFDRVPPSRMGDCYIRQHTVVIHCGGPKTTIERLVDQGTYEAVPVARGVVQFDPPGTLTGARWDVMQDVLILLPSELTFQRALTEIDNRDMPDFVRSNGIYDAQITQIGLALMAEMEGGFSSGRLYGESLALALASRLVSCFSARRLEFRTYEKGLARWRLRRTLDYIHDNLGGDLALADLAATAKLSEFYFCRLFKQSMGVTPHRYVMAQRIESAKALLANRTLSLEEIGRRLGFADQAHFTTAFRKATGMTPKQFRNRV